MAQRKEIVYVKACGKPECVPARMSNGAAGHDLYASETVEIGPHKTALFKSGISIELPFGYMASVLPRSGMSLKRGLLVITGTIDSDYRGEIGIIIHNLNDHAETITHGERIAQLVITEIPITTMLLTNKLSETERGPNGFGWTGK